MLLSIFMRNFFTIFCLFFAVNAYSSIVTIDLTWGFDHRIQEGSIIQVVAYRTGAGSYPDSGAENNFIESGELNGETVYNANSTVSGNNLLYSFSVSENSSGFFVFEQFEISYYNRIYLRIFESSDLESASESSWGLTRAYIIPQNGKPYTITIRDFEPTNTNLFGAGPFEVIPEAGVLSLVSAGFIILTGVTFLSRRKNAKRIP